MMVLREATWDDLDLLYTWANDPEVRRQSFNQEPIAYETHRKWFERILKDDTKYQFILMEGTVPVGQLRISVEGENAEIGYSIDRDYRRRGYGNGIIRLAVEKAKKELPQVKRLFAKVKQENESSLKVFLKQGFTMDYCVFSKELTEEMGP